MVPRHRTAGHRRGPERVEPCVPGPGVAPGVWARVWL
jgi:hypothetical protein